jgi:phenylalanyl-tRNA synthetase alpha chain
MSFREKINSVRTSFLTAIDPFPEDQQSIDKLHTDFLGRNGRISNLFSNLKSVDKKDLPSLGKELNLLKNELNSIFSDKIKELKSSQKAVKDEAVDFSFPGDEIRIGSIHILEQTLNEIKDIYMSIGFHVAYGPEVDDDYHNFEALNIPKHHPARDMQDTFFIDPITVLRTHTSNVQVHIMEEEEPPIRYIVPGRVYRNEAIGYKSYCLFHQVEGIYVNEQVSFGELKGCLEYFVNHMFGPKKKMRFRPSYFPFTEPSAEVDIWDENRGEWMEILGCGMVNPQVLKNVGYDTKKYRGYAFGMGVERIAMLKHGINDIRHFYSGDVRFLSQF